MKGENMWNKPTPEQAQILSLAAMIQGGNKGADSSGKSKTGKSKSGLDSTSNKKKSGIQPWMLIAPENGATTSMIKNDKEYHWCPKCAKGEGQWV